MKLAFQAYSNSADAANRDALKEKMDAMKREWGAPRTAAHAPDSSKPDEIPGDKRAEEAARTASQAPVNKSQSAERPKPDEIKKSGHEGVKQAVEELDSEYQSLLKEVDVFKQAHPDSSNYVSQKELEMRNAYSSASLHGQSGAGKDYRVTSDSLVKNLKTQMNEMKEALGKSQSGQEPKSAIEVNGNERRQAREYLADYRGISNKAIDKTSMLHEKYKGYISEADDKKMSKLVYELSVLQNDLDNMAEWGSTERGKNMQGMAARLMTQIDAKAAELNTLTAALEEQAKAAKAKG